jgi:hypothetical protein
MKKLFAMLLLAGTFAAVAVSAKDLPTPCCYPCTPGSTK